MSWPAFAAFFFAFVCVAVAAREILNARHGGGRARAESRLRAMSKQERQRALSARPGEEEGSILRGDLGAATRAGLWRRAELLLMRADLPVVVGRFTLLSLLLGTALAWISLLMFPSLLQVIPAFALGAALPWLFVWRKKRKRMALFEQQLPEALGLVTRALRAGHALPSGIQMVAQELDAPVADEFGRVADEISLGLETREALRHLCERVDVPDLAFFSVAVLIQRETGGNLAEIMDRLAHVIRERHLFYGKVRSMTAQNRGAALILLAAPFAFIGLMYRASPDFVVPLWTTSGGHMLSAIAIALTFVGYALARRLAVVHC